MSGQCWRNIIPYFFTSLWTESLASRLSLTKEMSESPLRSDLFLKTANRPWRKRAFLFSKSRWSLDYCMSCCFRKWLAPAHLFSGRQAEPRERRKSGLIIAACLKDLWSHARANMQAKKKSVFKTWNHVYVYFYNRKIILSLLTSCYSLHKDKFWSDYENCLETLPNSLLWVEHFDPWIPLLEKSISLLGSVGPCC